MIVQEPPIVGTVAEITEEVHARRQLATLRDLARRLVEAKTPEMACEMAARAMEANPRDIPCALFYLLDADGKTARLVSSVGFSEGSSRVLPPQSFLLEEDAAAGWPVGRVARERRGVVVSELGSMELPRGAWDESPNQVVVLPLASPSSPQAHGVLVVGVSPHRELDDDYRSFFDLVADQVASTILDARALEAQLTTARVRAAAELERQQLQRAADDARVEAERARAEAEAANRTKDEFLAMLGHELRNPLAPIVTALELLETHDEESSELARLVIQRQVGHLVGLVDDLLDVSRITRGQVELKKQVVEVALVIARAIELASPLLEQLEHKLTVDVASAGLAVEGDVKRLAQVVSNLLTNAAKHTERGGTITISAAREGDQIVLNVIDTGAGIDPEMLPTIFDMFVQERQPIDRSRGGLGLGLAIVHNLVAAHGGSVDVQSAGRGRGSVFTVNLLAARAAAPSAVDERHSPSPALNSGVLRILLVDDNEDAATMLALYLRRLGHVTRVVHDGPAALLAAAELVPDVALLDIGLPVMDGYELARRLRETYGRERLRLVAVTGYGQDKDRELSMEAGFDLHLVKPVARIRITAALEELVEERARTAGAAASEAR